MDSEMGIVAGILGFLGIFFLIIIAVAVLMIIAQFKVFKKGGEEGWKAIIPIYNQYTLCQIVGLNPNWICNRINFSASSILANFSIW